MIDREELDVIFGPIVIIQARVHDFDVAGVTDFDEWQPSFIIPDHYDPVSGAFWAVAPCDQMQTDAGK